MTMFLNIFNAFALGVVNLKISGINIPKRVNLTK